MIPVTEISRRNARPPDHKVGPPPRGQRGQGGSANGSRRSEGMKRSQGGAKWQVRRVEKCGNAGCAYTYCCAKEGKSSRLRCWPSASLSLKQPREEQSLRCPPRQKSVCDGGIGDLDRPTDGESPSSSESGSDLVNKGEAGPQSDGAETPQSHPLAGRYSYGNGVREKAFPPIGASGWQKQVAPQNEYWGPPLANLKSGLPSVWLRSRRMCQGSPRLVKGAGTPGRRRSSVL